MDRAAFRFVLTATVEMAHDFSLETRIRRLIFAHYEAGAQPRTLVMGPETWRTLVTEVYGYSQGYFWSPTNPPDGDHVSTFMGLPILVKDFMPDMEVVVGV